MREIGGYIELDKFTGKMLYDNAIKLNSARNALAYIIKANNIKKIYMPKFLCNSCDDVLNENKVAVEYYSIGINFKPIIDKNDGWIYIVNYYGQLTNDFFMTIKNKIIIDNVQAYFQEPLDGVDTIYSCRKYFGVPDGAILFSNKKININEIDVSYKRMNYLLGRYECGASEFYKEYVDNNKNFIGQPIKQMSKLTTNILHAIDYDYIKNRRKSNFEILHKNLNKINKLDLIIPEGPFMYPLFVENGAEIREKLIEKNIFVPTLWPNVFEKCREEELEYQMAKNIIPIPVDQRYDENDMRYIIKIILNLI